MRTNRLCRVRAPWRSRPRMSLAVQKIDSIRWRIGARCGPRAVLVLAAGAQDRGVQRGELSFELGAPEVLVADQDQHLPRLALAARDQLQAHEFLVDLGRGQRQRARRAVHRKQGVQSKPPEEPAVAGAVAVVSGVSELASPGRLDAASTRRGSSRRRADRHKNRGCDARTRRSAPRSSRARRSRRL